MDLVVILLMLSIPCCLCGVSLNMVPAAVFRTEPFNLTCSATPLVDVVEFFQDGTFIGRCTSPIPNFQPGVCHANIYQDITTDVTTLRFPAASYANRGNWSCTHGTERADKTIEIIGEGLFYNNQWEVPAQVESSSGTEFKINIGCSNPKPGIDWHLEKIDGLTFSVGNTEAAINHSVVCTPPENAYIFSIKANDIPSLNRIGCYFIKGLISYPPSTSSNTSQFTSCIYFQGIKNTCQGEACWLVPFLSVLIVGIVVVICHIIFASVRDTKRYLRKIVYRCIVIVIIILCSTGLISGLIAGLLRLNGITGFCCEVWIIAVSTVVSIILLWIVIVILFILLLIWKYGKESFAEENKSDPVVGKNIHDKEKNPRTSSPSVERTDRVSPLSLLSMVPNDRELPYPAPKSVRSEDGQFHIKPHHVPPLPEILNDDKDGKEDMPQKRKRRTKKVKKDKEQRLSPMLTDTREHLPCKNENALQNATTREPSSQKETKNVDKNGMLEKEKKDKSV